MALLVFRWYKAANTIEIHRGRFHMRTTVLASNFFRKRVLAEREWVKVGWMMSIDEESVLSVQLVPSFLPFFAFFFFYLIILGFCVFLLHLFLFNRSLSHHLFSLSLSSSLFQSTQCVYILTILTSSSLFIVYMHVNNK